jgi:hypothetical protein
MRIYPTDNIPDFYGDLWSEVGDMRIHPTDNIPDFYKDLWLPTRLWSEVGDMTINAPAKS